MVFLCGDDTEKHALSKEWRKTIEKQGEEEEDGKTRAIHRMESYFAVVTRITTLTMTTTMMVMMVDDVREREKKSENLPQNKTNEQFSFFSCVPREEKSEKNVYRRCYLAYWTIFSYTISTKNLNSKWLKNHANIVCVLLVSFSFLIRYAQRTELTEEIVLIVTLLVGLNEMWTKSRAHLVYNCRMTCALYLSVAHISFALDSCFLCHCCCERWDSVVVNRRDISCRNVSFEMRN